MGITDVGRQLIELLELDLDRCQETYGVGNCTAGRIHSGTAQAGGASTITLAAGASGSDDTYNSMVVRITGGTGSGQERIISDYVGATKVATVAEAWTTNPDATSTYNVIDRPNACYNTFRTCQDKLNFNKGTHTYRFIGRGAPIAAGQLLRPYITKAETTPTEIDPEKGLALRGKVSIILADEPDSDIEQDPYRVNRAAAAGGTFWTRLLARNHYAGRVSRFKRLYITPGAAYTLGDAGWVSEQYLIDAINGPERGGLVKVLIKDPLKLADRQKLPAPTDGELSVALTASALSLTLKSGQGAQYGTSGYVRVGEEVIQFTGRSGDVLSWPNTAHRGKFGTTAEAHEIDDRVQLCKAWIAATPATVLEEMLNAASIADANIDLAGISSEVSQWYSTYSITVCLTEPEAISKLLEEFCFTLQAVLWWSATDQKVKFKALRPLNPFDSVPAVLTDESNFIHGSVQVDRAHDDRITTAAVWYSLVKATAPVDEPVSYQRAYVVVDTDAEGANEYNERRQKTFYARFLDQSSDQAASELAVRLLDFRRDAPMIVRCKLDPKETGVAVGGQMDIETYGVVDFDGDVQRQRVFVTRRKDNGSDIEATLWVTFLNRRYFWIAPDGHPDYAVANDEQRKYGYISDANGFLSDGSQGHLII